MDFCSQLDLGVKTTLMGEFNFYLILLLDEP